MEIIGYVKSDFKTKFGVPRQAGVIGSLKSKIVFNREFSNPDAFRKLEKFSHIWILWEFSEAKKTGFSLTVRPPRLGGNTRVGVFASRSPFRPNSIGLSCVKLDMIEHNEKDGVILHISGGDMMDGTPVYDIKPYLPYSDCHPEAVGGYTENLHDFNLDVEFLCDVSFVEEKVLSDITDVLKNDPRPSYQNDEDRVYGIDFNSYNIKFKISADKVTVTEVTEI